MQCSYEQCMQPHQLFRHATYQRPCSVCSTMMYACNRVKQCAPATSTFSPCGCPCSMQRHPSNATTFSPCSCPCSVCMMWRGCMARKGGGGRSDVYLDYLHGEKVDVVDCVVASYTTWTAALCRFPLVALHHAAHLSPPPSPSLLLSLLTISSPSRS